eukprot:gene4508-4944_t
MSSPTYEVLLEKKGRGRGFALARPWAVRTFKLKEQSLEYYDSTKLKGTLNMAGSKSNYLTPKDADDKPFPFAVDLVNGEKLLLNASCDEIRQRCIQIFNLSASDANWTMPPERGQETAAAESVISIMSTNAERTKIEQEQKRLEEERLKEVTAATAKMMEEELANAKLREAEGLAILQQEEQEKHLAQMFKSMGAKARFFAARKEKKWFVAREAAAIMVQNAWRSKQARRRMLIRKAQKEQLKREAYARKIQSRYRIRLAKRRMAAIKAQKQRNRERLAAIKFQCAWRVHKARRLYKQKVDERMAKEVNRGRSRQRRIITIQSVVRRFLAIRRAARLRVAYPMVVNTILHKLEGLRGSEGDVCAFVSGLVLALPIGHHALVDPDVKVPLDLVKSAGKVTSHYRLESLNLKKEVPATALNQVDYIIVTLMDKNTSEFLGQAIVKVTDALRSPTPANFTVPLFHDLVIPILDSNQVPLVPLKPKETGQGSRISSRYNLLPQLTLGISIPSRNHTMCGWMWKVSESLLSNAWKKRWFILVDDELTYYNSDLALDANKNTINCGDVTALTEDSYKGRHAWKITFTVSGVESFWMLDFDESETAPIRAMWLRKLRRCSPSLQQESHAPRSPMARSGAGGDAKTRIPVSRRVSIFK